MRDGQTLIILIVNQVRSSERDNIDEIWWIMCDIMCSLWIVISSLIVKEEWGIITNNQDRMSCNKLDITRNLYFYY